MMGCQLKCLITSILYISHQIVHVFTWSFLHDATDGIYKHLGEENHALFGEQHFDSLNFLTCACTDPGDQMWSGMPLSRLNWHKGQTLSHSHHA